MNSAQIKSHLEITCHKCGDQLISEPPEGWGINIIGVVQYIHQPCGTVCNVSSSKMVVDQEMLEKNHQEDVLHEKLFAKIGDKK